MTPNLSSDIIDNRRVKLEDVLTAILQAPGVVRTHWAVGYLYIGGLAPLLPSLEGLEEVRVVMGPVTTAETKRILSAIKGKLEVEPTGLLAEQQAENRPSFEEKPLKEGADRRGTFERLGGVLAQQLEGLPQTDENQRLVRKLIELVEQGKLKVRVYLRERLHAKAYIFEYGEGSHQRGEAVVGSSNLTPAGLRGNTELNVRVYGEANIQALLEWYEEIWRSAQDFSPELLKVLKRSWAGPEGVVSPYELYLRAFYVLAEPYLEIEEIEDVLDELGISLEKFQKDAVKRLLYILEKHKEAFLSDVVGLGKTYMALAVLKFYAEKRNLKGLLVCPAALRDMWEKALERYDLYGTVRVETYASISRGDPEESLRELRERYDDRKIVVLDEGHRLKNPYSNRYKALHPFLSDPDRRVLLVTATPYNTRLDELKNLLLVGLYDEFVEAPVPEKNVVQLFKKAEELKEKNKEQEALEKVRELLQHFMVRRTRHFVIEHYLKSEGQVDESGRPYLKFGDQVKYFPRRHLHAQEYPMEGVYRNVDEILERIKELKLALYTLGNYVKPEKAGKGKYAELQSASKHLRGIMRVFLLKRFESSPKAFRETVRRMLDYHRVFIDGLENGVILSSQQAKRILRETESEEAPEDWEDILEALGEQKYEFEDFETDALLRDAKADAEIFEHMLELVPDDSRDAKLEALVALVRERLRLGEKVIVFTEYKDTANYIFDALKREVSEVEKALVSSDTKDVFAKIRRFSPRSNGYTLENGEKEINLLVSTDILSEGLNLQDANCVINYDFHWNPVRLVQRIGRIDRIGSEHEEVQVFNFLPTRAIERKLKIEERVSKRIKEYQEILGEDAEILRPDECPDPRVARIYAGMESVLDEVEAELETETLHSLDVIIAKVAALRRENPKLFEKISRLPFGVRSAKAGGTNSGRVLLMWQPAGHAAPLFAVAEVRDGTLVEESIRSLGVEKALKLLHAEPGDPKGKMPPHFNSNLTELFQRLSKTLSTSETNVYIIPDYQIEVARKLALLAHRLIPPSRGDAELAQEVARILSETRLKKEVRERIRKLRRKGALTILEALKNDPVLLEELRKAHKSEIARRVSVPEISVIILSEWIPEKG